MSQFRKAGIFLLMLITSKVGALMSTHITGNVTSSQSQGLLQLGCDAFSAKTFQDMFD